MRILDNQRYWAYIKAYVICFTALIGLYVVIDAFSNFDEFTKRATGAGELFRVMGRFYLVHTSEFYDRLCGVIGMMAAIFTVTWMQKNNELLAMLAAGISTRRVILPVIVSAVCVSGLSVANQEFIMPRLGEELQKRHDDDGSMKLNVSGRADSNMIYVHGNEADRQSQSILSFNATIPVDIFGKLCEIQALQARYIPEGDLKSPERGGWLARGVRLSLPLDAEQLARGLLVHVDNPEAYPPPFGDPALLVGDTYFLHTSLTFKALTRQAQWYQYATTPELIRSLADPANEENADIAVFLHSRIMRSILSLALLFVTLPQVLGGFGRNMFVNLGISLATAALFYGLCFLSGYLGNNAAIPPELAAWAPLIAFGTIAVIRWDAIRT